MEQTDEKFFFKTLADVPKLPDEIYKSIEGRIYPPRKKIRCFAVAASLLIFAGISVTTLTPEREVVQYSLDEEIVSELQLVHDYLNGYDIEEEDFFVSAIW